MLTRFFKKSQPISFVSIILILFAFILIHFIAPGSSPKTGSTALQTFGIFFFFTFIVFLVSFIVSKNYLTQANYYAILFFVLLIGLFPSVLSFSKISLSHLFVLLAARRLYSIRSNKQLLSKLFDSGFYIGIAFLLYPQAIIYLLLIYISYFIYNNILDKNILLPLVGFSTPIFIVFTYNFVFDKLEVFRSLIELNIGFELLKISPNSFLLPLVLVAIVLMISLFKLSSNFQNFEGENKNSTKLVIAHLILSILILTLNNLQIEESIQYLFFPIAVLFGVLFNLNLKNWIKELLLIGLLLSALFLPFFSEML